MESRAFRVHTTHGSTFLFRFDPEVEDGGILYGRIHFLGFAQSTKQSVEARGIGALPEVGGRFAVSGEPIEVFEMGGEPVPVYPTEEISAVVPIELPSRKALPG